MEAPERNRASTEAELKSESLYKLIEKRDDDVARGFNDFHRSTAPVQIGIIHSMGLFTCEELRRFSSETLQIIEMYARIPDA